MPTQPTQEELKRLYDERFLRYSKHLHEGLDITSLILKGHLFIEELLLEILKLHCRDVKVIESIQLSFHHKVKLVQALFGTHLGEYKHPEQIWPVLDKLNKLRNSLAHQIDSPEAVKRMNLFLSSCKTIKKDLDVIYVDEIPIQDQLLVSELMSLIFYLLGFLGCIYGIAFLNPPFSNSPSANIRIPDKIILQ